MSRSLPVMLAALALSVPASAQEVDPATGRPVTYAQRTELEFEDLDVEANVARPSEALVLETTRAAFNPLIRFRVDFAPELKASLDEVR